VANPLSIAAANAVESARTYRVRRALKTALWYLLLSVGSMFALFPLFWMISTGLKVSGHEWLLPPEWLPNPPVIANFFDVWTQAPILHFLRNSVLVTVLATTGQVISSAVVAFAFARLRYFGRDVWFIILLSTMMLPGIVTQIPLFVIYRHIQWLDTLLPLIVPYWLGGGAFNIFLMRQYFLTLPYELDEAARIDGASSLRILWQVVLPLSKPVLATVAIFGFISHWNDFMGPLIYTNSKDLRTVAVGLWLLQSDYRTPWNLLMAGATETLLPVLIIFFTFQRYFIRGIALTGMAGR